MAKRSKGLISAEALQAIIAKLEVIQGLKELDAELIGDDAKKAKQARNVLINDLLLDLEAYQEAPQPPDKGMHTF